MTRQPRSSAELEFKRPPGRSAGGARRGQREPQKLGHQACAFASAARGRERHGPPDERLPASGSQVGLIVLPPGQDETISRLTPVVLLSP
jgi:hypothetical protein